MESLKFLYQSSHSQIWFFTRSVKSQGSILGPFASQVTKSLLIALTNSFV